MDSREQRGVAQGTGALTALAQGSSPPSPPGKCVDVARGSGMIAYKEVGPTSVLHTSSTFWMGVAKATAARMFTAIAN